MLLWCRTWRTGPGSNRRCWSRFIVK